MTSGALVLGTLNGLLIGLLAVGLVLVYRSNRFLNLAHAQMGALPALLLAKVVLDWGVSWWLAFPACIAVGILTGVGIDRFLIQPLRARTSSKVSLLLMTIGATQLLLALAVIPALGPNGTRVASRGYPLPFHATVRVGGVILGGQHVFVAVLVPLLVGALAVFLRVSMLGKMIRAAAGNPDEARRCGISTKRVSMITWGIAGGLSAITAILQAPSQGAFNAAQLGPSLLLLSLGAAALGAFVSVPWALAGGLLLGLAQQLTLAQTSSGGTAELVVTLVILGVVLVRGQAISAAFAVGGASSEERSPVRVPEVLRAKLLVRRQPMVTAVVALAIAALVPLLPVLNSEAHRFELTLVLVYALIGIALTVLVGWAGQVSLGHFAVVGAGAFVAARLGPHGWSLPVLLIVAGGVGALFMVVVGLPALRVRGLTLALTTLGFGVVAPDWLFSRGWFGSTRPFGITVDALPLLAGAGRPASQLSVYYIALVLVAVVMLGMRALRSSGPGRLVIAVRDNERAVAGFGVTPATVKLGILAVSGFVAASAGVLWADAWRVVSANQFSPAISLSILAVPVIGGLGSVGGAAAGAVALYVPTFFLSPMLSGLFGDFGRQVGFQLALGGAGLVGVLLAYPGGLAGIAQRGWQWFLDRWAQADGRAEDRPEPVAAEVAVVAGAPVTVDERLDAPAGSALVVEGVRVTFGGLRALDGAGVTVGPGEIVGLIGPNGAGKTTLLDVVSGVRRPDAGSVRMGATEMVGFAPQLRAALGLRRGFQDASLFPGLTVVETLMVALGPAYRVGAVAAMLRAPWARAADAEARRRADAAIERFGLTAWADVLTSELSTGTRRICALAAQVVAAPTLLLLDEPTAGVAQRDAEAFGPLVRRVRDELSCGVLIVEHDMPLLMGLCDRVYAMVAGQVIAEGTPAEIRADPVVIASYLGTDVTAVARTGHMNGTRPRARRAPVKKKPAPRAASSRATKS